MVTDNTKSVFLDPMKFWVGCCLFILTSGIHAQERVVFEAGGTKGWTMFPKIESDSIYCAPVANVLRLAKGQTVSRGWFWLSPTAFNAENDFRIEARLRQTNGDIFNGFGIIYGFKDPDNYACFMISSWKQAKLASMENGRWSDWRDMLQLQSVKSLGNWNTITLEKRANEVTFIINDTMIFTTAAPTTYGNGLGFIAHSTLSFEAEYLKLTEAPPGQLKAFTSLASTESLPNATMRFHNILFDAGKAEVRRTSTGELNQVVGFLRSNLDIHVEIGGHTDDIGSEAANHALSERRARAVMNYLITKGIGASRINPVGYGEAQPIADNTTAEGRQKNRRVEFVMKRR